MTKKQAERWNFVQDRLLALGFERHEVETLFRIERTLSLWGERECGDANGRAIERDEKTGIPFMTYDNGGGARTRYKIADKERGAFNRLAAIMARYPGLWSYHQGDPRGCALYVGRWADMPGGDVVRPVAQERADLDSLYTRGVAVCI